MSVREYAILYTGARPSGGAVGGGNVLTTTAPHPMDGPEHTNQAAFQKSAEKGEPDGYAPLDGDGLVPAEHLPVLDALADVDAPAPDAGDVLTWDADTSSWVASPAAGGADVLNDLSDVDTSGVADGDFLAYDDDTDTWVPVGAPSGTVPSGADPGDLLVWDGSAWDVLPVGGDDEVLTADSGEALGVRWASGSGGGVGSPHGTLVQTKGNAGNGATVVITLDAAPTAGNVLILCCGIASNATLSLSQTNVTWTQRASALNGSGARVYIFTGVVAASAGAALTITRSTGSAWHGGSLMEWSGLSSDVPTQTATKAGGGTIATTPGRLVTPPCIVVGSIVRQTGGSNNYTSPLFIGSYENNFIWAGYRRLNLAHTPIGVLAEQDQNSPWAAAFAELS